MHLLSVELENYQSYARPTTVGFVPGITILAGRNNVGKSAFLRGLRLPVAADGVGPDTGMTWRWKIDLSDIHAMTGEENDEAWKRFERTWELFGGELRLEARFTLREPALAIDELDDGRGFRGRPIRRDPRDRRGNGRPGPVEYGEAPRWLGSEIVPRMGGLCLVRSDIVSSQPSAEDDSLVCMVSYASDDGPRLALEPSAPVSDDDAHGFMSSWFALLTRLCTPISVSPRRVGAEPAAFSVQRTLEADGGNLTAVVATLYNNERMTTFHSLERFLTDAFPEISRLDVVMSGLPTTQPVAEIHVVYSTGAGSQLVPLRYCGTGVEQLLMLGAAVLTAPRPALLLMDEPHAFLHPVAERRLLAFIREHSEHQYVVATHSPVFLSSVRLSNIRLVSRDASGSSVDEVGRAGEVLDEIGITAADLWSAEAILWMEGASDRLIAEQVRDLAGLDQTNAIRVAAMPDWIRSAAASERRMLAAVQFCDTVQRAVAPLPVRAMFVFDGDEWPEEQKRAIARASGDRARYLAVREVENLLLCPAAIHEVLSEVCRNAGVQEPTLEEVGADLAGLLRQMDNRRLYRQPVPAPDPSLVIGSHVLAELWWRWARADYDKVADGPALARAVISADPTALRPLVAVIHELAEDVKTSGAAKRRG